MSLEAFAFAVPSIRQTAEDIAAATGASADFVAEKVGLKERYILAEDETGVGLSVNACLSMFQKNPALRSSVDLLVCVTQNPDRRIPHNSAAIAHKLGLGNNVASFDISLGCSGYVYAIKIVEGFLQSCGMQNALLVTCDPYSRIIAAENKDTNSIFGDVATVTWIKSGEGRSRVIATDFGSEGGGGDAITIPAGGAERPFVSLLHTEVQSYLREDLRLHMNGRSVFNFVMTRIPQSINSCLEKAGLDIGDIDYFALHQGSVYMLDALAKRCNIPQERLLKNMHRYGNVVSSSIPLLLAELDLDNKLSHSVILASGFGVGLSWGSAVIKFD